MGYVFWRVRGYVIPQPGYTFLGVRGYVSAAREVLKSKFFNLYYAYYFSVHGFVVSHGTDVHASLFSCA